jgi:hypothetical protein
MTFQATSLYGKSLAFGQIRLKTKTSQLACCVLHWCKSTLSVIGQTLRSCLNPGHDRLGRVGHDKALLPTTLYRLHAILDIRGGAELSIEIHLLVILNDSHRILCL